MTDNNIQLNPNPIVRFLGKPMSQFTKEDIIKVVKEFEIEMIKFRYVANDGKLKTLNFIINSLEHLDDVLTAGERVDGSSLFPFLEAGSSDLYVVPRFRTAFIDPFAEIPTLDILCNYYTYDGKPFAMAPEYTLAKAAKAFTETTGMEFETMGELEYYVIAPKEEIFLAADQRGYHTSAPYCKFENYRTEAMKLIAECGGLIKYGHSEVGNFTVGDTMYEQNEIEFLPTNIQDSADQLVIAKWIMRNLAYQYGITVTFAPKITVGKAGSGMHIHTRVSKDGKNMYVGAEGLTETAHKTIAGMLDLAASLTAFGNTNPTSYFRLVPHQEAPTSICWGDRNRSVLVRVPLGWLSKGDMVADANPMEKPNPVDGSFKQTVEFRCPDGSADIYLLLAGLVVAARCGFEMKDPLAFAKETYVDVNIFDEANREKADSLKSLPTSCYESGVVLEQHREFYERHGVFTPELINDLVAKLKSYNDQNIREELEKHPERMMEIVKTYYHCG